MFSSFFVIKHESDKINYITKKKTSWTLEEDSSTSGVADMTNTDSSATSTVSALFEEALDLDLVLHRGPSSMVIQII